MNASCLWIGTARISHALLSSRSAQRWRFPTTIPAGARVKSEQFIRSGQIREANLVVIWRTVIFIVFVCLSLIAITAWHVWDARLHALRAADIAAANLTQSLAVQAQRLADWRESAQINLVVLGILLLIVGLAGRRLVRHARERARSEIGALKSLNAIHNLEQALNEHALVSVTDMHGTILRANDTFCKVSKYRREELVGRDHGMLNSGYHSAEFIRSLWETLQAGEIWQGEIRNRAKDGSLYWVRSTMVPFFDEHGQVFQYVSIRTDITERKKAENVLAQARQTLEENNRNLARLAHLDALTGLANRRRFDQIIDVEFRRTLRVGQPLSLLMIDVDFFKRYNDLYGHVAGDDCLKQVADILRTNQRRAGDLAARYGGEEFVVILPNTDSGGAALVAENIRAQTESVNILHSASDLGKVTLSIGVYSMVPVREKNTAQELVQLADAFLYQAKHAGRNRVRAGMSESWQETNAAQDNRGQALARAAV